MPRLVTYRIDKIDYSDFILVPKEPSFAIDGKDCEVTLTMAFSFHPKDEKISITLGVAYKDKRDGTILMSINQITSFNIINFVETFQFMENGKMTIPDPFLSAMISISIGTCRGIVFGLIKDSYLKGIYLPVYKIQTFIDELKGYVSKPQETKSEEV